MNRDAIEMRRRALPRLAGLAPCAAFAVFAVFAAFLAFGAPDAQAQAPGARAAPGLRVNLYIDERRNKQARELIGDDFGAYVYGQARTADGSVRVQPANEKLMALWKGNAVLNSDSDRLWETPDQFAPVLMVVDVTNEGTTAAEIVRSTLRVADSVTDRQPFIRMASSSACGGALRTVQFWNDGWRVADNAVLSWRFQNGNTVSPEFRAELGQIGNVAFEPERALLSLMPRLAALRAKPPRCTRQRLKQCFAQLESSGDLGRLAGIVRLDGNDADGWSDVVTVTLSGTLAYQWKHHPSNETRTRQQPFADAVHLFKFDTGDSVECGAGGPGESGFNPVKLQTDVANYTVPLPYRGPVPVRGNRRFELTLKADRASSHKFEVVVETSDGRQAVSPPVDLLYFVPTKTRSPMRELK